MRSINLFVLTCEIPRELMPLFEKALSARDEALKIRCEEIELIKILVDSLRTLKVRKQAIDDWFYSFTIPQIGKEFDLLKIGKDNITINIELKSQDVSQDKIEQQLLKNKYYLNHISEKVYCFTCVKCENGLKIYVLANDVIKESSIQEIAQVIELIQNPVVEDIEKLFNPSEYLISPLNTPEKFLKGKYYLNNQQEEIKKKIMTLLLQGRSLCGIKGSAGTGKSLLLYDIAKELSVQMRVGVIHCGLLCDGHRYLNLHMKNVDIIDAKSISEEWLKDKAIICADETQRLYKSSLDLILQLYADEVISGCVFSYDPVQALSKAEVRRNNPKRLGEIPNFHEAKLTERIRTNKKIYSFIRNMMRLRDVPQREVDYSDIDIVYANDNSEADNITLYHRQKGYTQISFTPSRFVHNRIDHYAALINSHQVIGQEFDNVLVVLDDNFRYNAVGDLEGKEHPNPDYLFPRLFYQNISRAREKLCIVVLDNIELFERLLQIKEHVLFME